MPRVQHKYLFILVISKRIHLYLVDTNIQQRKREKEGEKSKTNYETNQMHMLSIANAYVDNTNKQSNVP